MADQTKAQARLVVTRAEATMLELPRFWTGVPCRHGHVSERLTFNKGRCAACLSDQASRKYRLDIEASRKRSRETGRKKYLEKPDQARERSRRWAANNPNKVKAQCHKRWHNNPQKEYARYLSWRAANASYVKDARKKSYQANKKRDLKAAKVWRIANRDKMIAGVLKWQAAHPLEVRAITANRRARRLAAGGSFTADDVRRILAIQRNKCAHSWCQKSLKTGYHVDHIKPLSRGGSNDRRNIQALCPPCNMSKHDTHPVDFAQQNGQLL